MASARVVLIERGERIEPDIEQVELVSIDCELISTAVDSADEVIEAIAGADVVLDSSLPMPRHVIETLDRCRLIVRMGHGYEGVDLEAATEAGIMVANTAGATSEEVSNHALALLLGLARRLYELDPGIRQGRWGELWARDSCSQIWDETLGIFGFGHIGRAMARKTNALRMEVIACDPYVGPWADLEEGVSLVSFDELLERSDFVSIHSAYTLESHHAFDAKAFRKMKPSAYLINTSRGSVVDEQALIEALQSGEIAGAGIDVFDAEPPDHANPLLTLNNVIVTPHVAGSSPGGWERIRRSAAGDAARVLRGEMPHCLVNPEVIAQPSP